MFSRLLRRLQGRPTPVATIAVAADALAVAPAVRHVDPAPDLPTPAVQARFLAHLFDVPADAATVPDAAADVLERLDAMSARLDVARLPRLPAIVPQVLAALRRDDGDATSLAALLERDPTLAGDVVRVANSAHFARGASVRGLVQAVGTIGADGVRYAVLTSVARPILQADPARQGMATGERLTAHCEARTWRCGELAAGRCDAAEAQLASIVAATGTAALLRMLPRSLLAQAAADPSFAPRLFTLAGTLAARAARHWHLSEPLSDAVARYSDADAGATPLVRVLAQADRSAMLDAIGVGEPAVSDVMPADTTSDAAALAQH